MTDTPIPPKKERAPRNPPVVARDREIVKRMAMHGMPVTDMAILINRGEAYIRKNFVAELRIGTVNKKLEIMDALHSQVKGRPAEYDRKGNCIRAEIVPDRACIIFSAKTICGLKETSVNEFTGKDGGPIAIQDARERLWALVDRGVAAREEEAASQTSH